MMVFNARNVLAIPTTKFCDRNMQLGNAEPDDSEEYFSKIPFDKVFHEGGTGGDRTIIEHRCAEVLATSPMPLAGNLQWIYCRTDAERDTLLHLLGNRKSEWASRIVISDDLLVFERKYVFVDSVTMQQEPWHQKILLANLHLWRIRLPQRADNVLLPRPFGQRRCNPLAVPIASWKCSQRSYLNVRTPRKSLPRTITRSLLADENS